MDYETAKAEKARIESLVDQASKELQKFPRGPMGLTPDSVKATAEWKKAHAIFNSAFAYQRGFNTGFMRLYKKQWREECHAKRTQQHPAQ